jgi:hypothetical protein
MVVSRVRSTGTGPGIQEHSNEKKLNENHNEMARALTPWRHVYIWRSAAPVASASLNPSLPEPAERAAAAEVCHKLQGTNFFLIWRPERTSKTKRVLEGQGFLSFRARVGLPLFHLFPSPFKFCKFAAFLTSSSTLFVLSPSPVKLLPCCQRLSWQRSR